MITYLLDTNIVSYSIKPIYSSLRKRIAQELTKESLAISAATRAELRAGHGLMQNDDRRIPTLNKLFGEILTLDWTAECADIYGELDSYLVKTGQSIGVMDTQIAAHAIAESLVLVTHNIKHFKRIPGLKYEDWTQADHTAFEKKKQL